MNTCDKCIKHDICGIREEFGADGCIDDFQPKLMTNADKIRSMNDEELGKFLTSATDDAQRDALTHCDYQWLDWLQSESGE